MADMASERVTARLSREVLDILEHHEEALAKSHPALGITRTDALQDLILRGYHSIPKGQPVRAFELVGPPDAVPVAGKAAT